MIPPVARSIYTRNFPSSTRHLDDVRRFVEAHAVQAHLPEPTVEGFKIAVDEACTNVIKHAYRGEEGHAFTVIVVVDDDRFTVRIRDEGVAFQQHLYREPDIFEAARRRRPGGFGVHIMHRLMDQVEYRTQGTVNEVSLTKYRNGR